MRNSEVAALANVSVQTLRYYDGLSRLVATCEQPLSERECPVLREIGGRQ